jgi:flagellar hook-associated protein 3 FlgL
MNMPNRVTERSLASITLLGLQGNLTRLGTLQQQLSSGKLISRPSDSPTGTVSAMQIRADLRQHQQYVRNAEDGKGWLDATDGALIGAVGLVNEVRGLVLQGMSAGVTVDPTARESLATQVDRVRESLLAAANTRYLNRPVFGGTTTGALAFDGTTGYAGDGGAVLRRVAGGDQVRVDTPAAATFGTGSEELFTLLSTISTHLRTDQSALGSDLNMLDTASGRMRTQLADVGSRYNRLTQAAQAATDRMIGLQGDLSEVEDIDLPRTIMELQLAQTSYEAALAATAKVVQHSLLDFLR